MRIGIFTDAYVPQIGGVSTSTLLLKNGLASRGHKVYVFTTSDPAAPLDEHSVIRVPSLPFVSAKRVALNYNPMLTKRVRNMKLDLIHTQTEFGLGIFGRSICRQTGIPHVHTYHTIYEDWVRGQLRKGLIERIARDYVRRLSKTFCNSAQHIIVPTEKTRHILEQYGVRRPLHTIPTGINLKRFALAAEQKEQRRKRRAELGIEPEDSVLLYLGRISEEKGIDELFAYLKKILPQRPRLHFVLVGEGPERDALMRFSERNQLTGQVHFTGGVPVARVPEMYALGDVFMSASRSETQGLTYIEALATGLPILVRWDEALEGVVDEGENGYYFRDEESFLDGLFRLLEADGEERAARARRAMRSSARYSVEFFVDSVESLYEKALAGS